MIQDSVRRFLAPRLALLSVLVALAFVTSLAGRWHWVADLFAHFAPHYFIAALTLFGLHLWSRQFRWAALALTVVVSNGVLLAPYLLPWPASGAGDGDMIRILQFNLSSSNPAPLAGLGYIRTLKSPPDIVIFIEATPDWTPNLRLMKDEYSTIARIPRRDNFGMAVLSRLPGTQLEFREVGNPPVPLIVLTAPVNGKEFRVYAMHPPPPLGGLLSQLRDAQLKSIADEISSSTYQHVMVAGDLNATPWSHSVRVFFNSAGMRDAQRGFGYLPTWAPPPLSRWLGIPIDLTLVSRRIDVISRDTGPWLGSDHWPVQTTVTLR